MEFNDAFKDIFGSAMQGEPAAKEGLSNSELASQINLLTARITGSCWKVIALIEESP